MKKETRIIQMNHQVDDQIEQNLDELQKVHNDMKELADEILILLDADNDANLDK